MFDAFTLHHGDCIEVMRTLPDNSVDSIVCDPPYGLSKEPDMPEVLRHWLAGDDYKHTGGGFMGRSWDSFVPGPLVWREALRVLKPGGHLLAFFGSRTYDIGTLAIRIAEFEIRDQIQWLYGSGFPKSKNLDGEWKGWGTALKPAHEPICIARKPLIGTVAANVLKHGTGALNIDACRVGWPNGIAPEIGTPGWGGPSKKSTVAPGQHGSTVDRLPPNPDGRWPANVIHDGSEEVLSGFPDAPGQQGVAKNDGEATGNSVYRAMRNVTSRPEPRVESDKSAARFFYCAKASKADRGAGNTHPTVKPTDLMQYLCRLVTPPGGVVLDPFMGSGSTGKAAMREGFRFIGIEREVQSFEIAKRRLSHAAFA